MAAHLQLTELARVLHKHLTCRTPIQTQDQFKADAQFREIEQALETSVTTIFIHGDLAQGKMPHSDVIDGTYLCDRDGQRDFVVIDEFDEITTEREQRRFANFVERIARQRTPVRFVLCGVSQPIRQLLGAHESIYDYVDTGRHFSKHPAPRGTNVSEQALETSPPYHVYVLSEKLFWEMFEDPTFARSLQ